MDRYCEEPTLVELLSDPATLAMMDADGVDRHDLAATLSHIARRLTAVPGSTKDNNLARTAIDASLIDPNCRELGPASPKRPSCVEAEEAVRTLIRWAGEDPRRQGLLDTPKRVLRAYEEWFSGYQDDPTQLLERCFEEIAGYDEIVLLRDVTFQSHCEHHMAPITGRVHIGYLPNKRVIGISKLVRLVQVFSKRLQIQERMTAEIATAIDQILKPRGTAVVIHATHACMIARGVHACGASVVTSRLLGAFRDNLQTRQTFFAAVDFHKNGHPFGS